MAPSDAALAALDAAERGAARAYLAQGDALLEVWRTGPPDSRTGRRPQALAEAAVRLGLSESVIDVRLDEAVRLRELSWVRRLVLDGRLGVPHARALLGELAVVSSDLALADAVARRVLTGQGRLGWDSTPARLRVAARRALVRLDPAGSAQRHREAQEQATGVRLRALRDGLADLVCTGAGEQLQAADRLLDAVSGPAGPDDTRSRGQRKLSALLAALVERFGARVPLELQLEVPVEVVVAQALVADGPLEPVVVRADLDAELLGVLAGDPVPPATGSGARVDELVGIGPVDRALLRGLLADPRGLPLGLGSVVLRRVCVDRDRQVVAVDARATPLAGLAPGSGPAALLARLLHGLPAPPPTTHGYRPTSDQYRVVRARDATCCFPGCGRRSSRADLDHRLAWPAGPTSTSNLQPLCRRHHRLKQDGWGCERDAAGGTTWTSPRGQRARGAPGGGAGLGEPGRRPPPTVEA